MQTLTQRTKALQLRGFLGQVACSPLHVRFDISLAAFQANQPIFQASIHLRLGLDRPRKRQDQFKDSSRLYPVETTTCCLAKYCIVDQAELVLLACALP